MFLNKVKQEIETKFFNEFDYNKNQSLFGWLTGVSGGRGRSIIYRAKGNSGMAVGKRRSEKKETKLDREIGDGITVGDLFSAPKDIRQTMFENEAIELGGTEAAVRKSKLRRAISLDSKIVDIVIESAIKTYGSKLPDVRTGRITPKLGKGIETGKVKIDSKNKTISVFDVKTGKKLFEQKLTEYEFKDLVVKEGEIIKKGQPIVEGYRQALERGFEIELKKPIQDMLGTEGSYNDFLSKHGEAIFEAIPVKTLVDWELKIPKDKRIFTKHLGRTGVIDKIKKLIKEDKLEVDAINKAGQGVNIFEKLKYPGKEKWLAWFGRNGKTKELLGYEHAEGSPGNNKDQ